MFALQTTQTSYHVCEKSAFVMHSCPASVVAVCLRSLWRMAATCCRTSLPLLKVNRCITVKPSCLCHLQAYQSWCSVCCHQRSMHQHQQHTQVLPTGARCPPAAAAAAAGQRTLCSLCGATASATAPCWAAPPLTQWWWSMTRRRWTGAQQQHKELQRACSSS